jgi:hypothetical protein
MPAVDTMATAESQPRWPLTLTVAGLPPSPNRRMAWQKQRRLVQPLADAVAWQARANATATVSAAQTTQAQQTVTAQQTAQTAVRQTVAAGQTATVAARQAAVAIRAAAQETAVRAAEQETAAAAQARDTAVAQQRADAAVQQTVVAQETAAAVSQQVAAAQAAAQATADAPHDTPLGIWNNKCVVQSTTSDETVTWDSDNTWAQGMCANFLAGNSTYVPFPTNNARPGSIQCAFIRLYGSGLWREFSDYANPPSGDAQIAVRATSWGDAASDCASIADWTAQQNAGNRWRVAHTIILSCRPSTPPGALACSSPPPSSPGDASGRARAMTVTIGPTRLLMSAAGVRGGE